MIPKRRDKGKLGLADPYPFRTLKRVNGPTTLINDDQVQRVDERENGFNRAGRGNFGLQDFCDKCAKCARECPSGSISHGDKIIHNGYEKWPNAVEKCTGMRVGNRQGAVCGTCIKVCPWSKPYTPFHRKG